MPPSKDEIRDFSELIENLADELDCNYIEAIVEHCNKTGMEIEIASTLVSSALKAKIREDAMKLNMLKREAELPI